MNMKNILGILIIITLVIVFLPNLYDLVFNQEKIDKKMIKTLEYQAVYECNKTAAEKLIYIYGEKDFFDLEKARFFVKIVREIEENNTAFSIAD